MATNENLIPIPGRLHSVATEGHVAGADEIYDDTIGKTQAEINQTIEPLPDNLAYLGDDDGQAVIPGFDPQTDTLHKAVQVLTTAEKDQVAQNLNNRPSTNGMARIELKATDNFKSVVEAQTGGNTIFVIKYDYTLTGNVTVPANCILEFNGGSISGAYTITLNNTKVIDGNFVNCLFSGTFQNNIVYSFWFTGEDTILSAISSCCVNSRTFVFSIGEYEFTKPICLYNAINLVGEESSILKFVNRGTNGKDACIICGTDYKASGHDCPWHGNIKGLNMLGVSGTIEYGILLANVKNCSVTSCHVDFSNSNFNVVNKHISAANNSLFAYTSVKKENINIDNNIVICDDANYTKASGGASPESISATGELYNVSISNNKVYKSSDDLGFHGVITGVIKNNYIETYDARIIAHDSTDIEISGNKLIVEGSVSQGMNIMMEFLDRIPKNIVVCNNSITKRNTGSLSYGLRIYSGDNISVYSNVFEGQIMVEQVNPTDTENPDPDAPEWTEEERVANNVHIFNNRTTNINISAKPAYQKFFSVKDNITGGITTIYQRKTFVQNNRIPGVGTQTIPVFYAYKYNSDGVIEFTFNATQGTVGDNDMTCNGETTIMIPRDIILNKYGEAVNSDGKNIGFKVKSGDFVKPEITVVSQYTDYDVSSPIIPANTPISIKAVKYAGLTYTGTFKVRLYYWYN